MHRWPRSTTNPLAAFNQAKLRPVKFASYLMSNSYPSAASLKEWIQSPGIFTIGGDFEVVPRLSSLGQPEVTLVINPNPMHRKGDVTQTLGRYLLETYVPMMMQSTEVDGFYVDSLGSWGRYYNYRREHFASERVPLAHEDTVLQPGILNHRSITEFLWALRDEMSSGGRVVMGNDASVQVVPPLIASKVLPFASFALDIVAAEVSGIIGTTVNAALYRCLAYRKPVIFLVEDGLWEHIDPLTRDNIEKVKVLENLFLASFPFDSAAREQISITERAPVRGAGPEARRRRLAACHWCFA